MTGVVVTKPDVMMLFLWFMMLQNQCVGNRMSPGPRSYRAVYLGLSAGDLTNTLSHICGSWYLPMFLLRDGSLTLIRIASLMDLAILWSFLPTMLKFSMAVMTSSIVVVMDG